MTNWRGAYRALIGLALATATLSGCSSDDDDDQGGNGTGSGSGASSGAAAASGNGDGNGNGDGTGASSSGSAGSSGAGGGGIDLGEGGSGTGGPSGPIGLEDSCDGMDNDKNGIIDDVDVGRDGICDCIRIATLGDPGKWGVGDVFDTWLNQRSTNGAANLKGAKLTAEELDKHQVIVVQNVSELEAYSAAEVAAMKAWVAGGGGLMTLIGYSDSSERENVNALLEPFGLGYGPEQILQKSGGSTIPITDWIGTHPVSDRIEAVGVDNGYPVVGEGTTLATKAGYDLLKVKEVVSGHVIVWGDEWITYNTEWVEHPDYQVERFWVNAIKWLTPANECQVPIPPSVE
jgi:hypothetical protein